MLCQHAIHAYEIFGSYDTTDGNSGQRRGMLINYESLPGFVPRVLLPQHFGIQPSFEWISAMAIESTQYSKGRSHSSKSGDFVVDSEDKEKRSTEGIRIWSDRILQPTYNKLLELSMESIILSPKSLVSELKPPSGNPVEVQWSSIKSIITPPPPLNSVGPVWNPFSSNHSSIAYQVFYIYYYVIINLIAL